MIKQQVLILKDKIFDKQKAFDQLFMKLKVKGSSEDVGSK